MERQIFKWMFLLCIGLNPVQSEEFPDVSMRFHSQWELGPQDQQKLLKKYGVYRVSFDEKGQAIPHGIPPELISRWKCFYEICMRDGCYYCDTDVGSCETGTCGPENGLCKPYMGSEGLPVCGVECADYAFISTLT